jgi:hypothetical protein
MSEENAMTPEELAAAFYAPSAEQGPEAAPLCLICKEVRVENEHMRGVCWACRDKAEGWRPDPGPRQRKGPVIYGFTPQVQAQLNSHQPAAQPVGWQIDWFGPRKPVPGESLYSWDQVDRETWRAYKTGMILGGVLGVLGAVACFTIRDLFRASQKP